MLERVMDWVRARSGAEGAAPPEQERYARRYEAAEEPNITAIIANKLAALAFADSTMEVMGQGARAELVRQAVEPLWSDGGVILAQALGKGGKVLVPVVQDGRICVRAVDQSRMLIRKCDGGRLVDISLLCDMRSTEKRQYFLWADYALNNGEQRIAYRVSDDRGEAYPLKDFEDWSEITAEMCIPGTDRLLLAFLRCPRDNRTDRRDYGVPVTYGAEPEIGELLEHMRVYRREYRLSRMMLGLDSGLWRNPVNGAALAADISAVKKTVQDSDDPFVPWEASALEGRSAWQVYAPQIRYEAMEARYNSLCRRVEKACGLSQGVLTERQQISYANRDEIRASMYDTFCVVRAVRGAWERAMQDVAYAVDVLAECFGLTPAGGTGRWQLRFDWDYGLIESTEQTFEQNMQLMANGLMSGPEVRQWALGGTLRQAKQAVRQIWEKEGEQDDER